MWPKRADEYQKPIEEGILRFGLASCSLATGATILARPPTWSFFVVLPLILFFLFFAMRVYHKIKKKFSVKSSLAMEYAYMFVVPIYMFGLLNIFPNPDHRLSQWLVLALSFSLIYLVRVRSSIQQGEADIDHDDLLLMTAFMFFAGGFLHFVAPVNFLSSLFFILPIFLCLMMFVMQVYNAIRDDSDLVRFFALTCYWSIAAVIFFEARSIQFEAEIGEAGEFFPILFFIMFILMGVGTIYQAGRVKILSEDESKIPLIETMEEFGVKEAGRAVNAFFLALIFISLSTAIIFLLSSIFYNFYQKQFLNIDDISLGQRASQNEATTWAVIMASLAVSVAIWRGIQSYRQIQSADEQLRQSRLQSALDMATDGGSELRASVGLTTLARVIPESPASIQFLIVTIASEYLRPSKDPLRNLHRRRIIKEDIVRNVMGFAQGNDYQSAEQIRGKIKYIERVAELDEERDGVLSGTSTRLRQSAIGVCLMTKVMRSHLSISSPPLDVSEMLIDESNFSKFKAQSFNFSKAKCAKSNFSNSNLSYSVFYEADMSECVFRNAFMHGTNFRQANLTKAAFKKAWLIHSNFSNADLSETDFEGANITSANFSNARNLTPEQLKKAHWFKAPDDAPDEVKALLRPRVSDPELEEVLDSISKRLVITT